MKFILNFLILILIFVVCAYAGAENLSKVEDNKMALTEFAKNYHEKMASGYRSDLWRTDPEFIERFGNFAFDEVINQPDQGLDDKTRYMAILAVLIGSQSVDLFQGMAQAALNFGITPVELKEIIYQAVAYLGMGRVMPFLKAANEILEARGLKLPLEPQATVSTDREERRERGTQAQVEIFGDNMRDFWKGGHINYWLADNCFGDYYTRKGLDYKQREMITFCFLYAQGGCEPQVTAHALGNFNVGNDKDFLIRVVSQCLPYIGYPRSLNALACVNKAAEQAAK